VPDRERESVRDARPTKWMEPEVWTKPEVAASAGSGVLTWRPSVTPTAGDAQGPRPAATSNSRRTGFIRMPTTRVVAEGTRLPDHHRPSHRLGPIVGPITDRKDEEMPIEVAAVTSGGTETPKPGKSSLPNLIKLPGSGIAAGVTARTGGERRARGTRSSSTR